jgi:hypothetical protein
VPGRHRPERPATVSGDGPCQIVRVRLLAREEPARTRYVDWMAAIRYFGGPIDGRIKGSQAWGVDK